MVRAPKTVQDVNPGATQTLQTRLLMQSKLQSGLRAIGE